MQKGRGSGEWAGGEGRGEGGQSRSPVLSLALFAAFVLFSSLLYFLSWTCFSLWMIQLTADEMMRWFDRAIYFSFTWTGTPSKYSPHISPGPWRLSQWLETDRCIMGRWPCLYHWTNWVTWHLWSPNRVAKASRGHKVTCALSESRETTKWNAFVRLPFTLWWRLGRRCNYPGY